MSAMKAGLIGEHISRTRLPDALNILCRAQGLTLDFDLIDTAGLDRFNFVKTVNGMRAEGRCGVTVTHPYKTDAADYAGNGMLPDLRNIGACNTLIFGEKLCGHNTDFTGFIGAWQAEMTRPPGRVAMAGAGGVARALGPALARLGARDIVIWDRDAARAQHLADRIGVVARAVPEAEAASAIAKADGLVNATPIGMREYPGSAFDATLLGPQAWAFDAVYTPTDTEFLQAAGAVGLQCLSGFSLFQHMVIDSFAAYSGISSDVAEFLPRLNALRPGGGG